ncbi:hypothetical protein GCM10009682_10580 [Luedemannella flava]|uniref:Uncharacterized protein n=1 Tax=Luedemannella flava TaxID=349316 RepID=A0ABN2LJ61_9ACTN
MTTSGAREMLVVVGLAVVGLIMAAVVTFAFDGQSPMFPPIVDITSPDGPLP